MGACSLLHAACLATALPYSLSLSLAVSLSSLFALSPSLSLTLASCLSLTLSHTLVPASLARATSCMTQAQYFDSGEVATPDYHHYGLASPIYTHFTSPIRRCARRSVASFCCCCFWCF